MPRLRFLCAFCLLALSCTSLAYSQTLNATLLGTVTDPSGAVVPNAKVTITETNTGVSRIGQTNGSGNYLFPNLAPGIYLVNVEASGFKKETRRDITLLVDTSTRTDVQLSTGAVTETVEVTGAPPILQTDTASTGQKIETETLKDQPLISSNRNFQGLLNLVPGVAPVQEQHSQFFNASTSLQTDPADVEVPGVLRPGSISHDVRLVFEGDAGLGRMGDHDAGVFFPGLTAVERAPNEDAVAGGVVCPVIFRAQLVESDVAEEGVALVIVGDRDIAGDLVVGRCGIFGEGPGPARIARVGH